MNIDGVFSGGGVKAFAFIGALEEVEKQNHSFVRVTGTSSGAIIAGFIAAGYKAKELHQLYEEMNLKQLMDPTRGGKFFPFMKWLYLYFSMGLYKGDRLERWLYQRLAAKGVYQFGDLPKGSLKIVASDITLGKMIVLPDDVYELYGLDPNQLFVSRAIRMSAGFPYFFVPEKVNNKKKDRSLIVDGGLLSNFPIWVLENDKETRVRPILGMKLSETIGKVPANNISNAIDMFQALFTTMLKAHDTRHISSKQLEDIILIPVKEVDATDFEINDVTKEKLIEIGKRSANSFLKYWP